MLISPPSIYIKDTGTPKGRGVFAARAFTDGEVVEICPVVVIWSTPYKALPKEIQNIVFFWELQKGLSYDQAFQALALGYGSMYNHNNPANMRYEIDKQALLIRYIAVRDIHADEELTVNYSGKDGAAVADDDWWFKEKKIKPITG